MKKLSTRLLILLMMLTLLVGCRPKVEKPVLYLYPEVTTEVFVSLDYSGTLFVTYPEYKDGWHVIAHPNGTLVDPNNGNEYSYLFWEGIDDFNYDMSQGFVVKGEDTVEFLREKLAFMGLEPKEYNEFIVYWLPKMKDNSYNLITFQTESYVANAKLNINPQPDSILRILMVYKPLKKPISIEPQNLESFERYGFSVIEWGGKLVK